MWWAVDLLASEYGGGPRVILDTVYLDELILLTKQINRRRANDYKMQLLIAHSKDPNELYKKLDSLEKKDKPVQFDDAGFENLKLVMSRSGKIVVK